MENFKRHTFYLLVMELIILAAGSIIHKTTGWDNAELSVLSAGFVMLTILCMYIFFKGQTKKNEQQIKYTLASLGSKFVIELFFAFFWFFLLKKTAINSLVLFFVLYLAFTIFLLQIILKSLKDKNL